MPFATPRPKYNLCGPFWVQTSRQAGFPFTPRCRPYGMPPGDPAWTSTIGFGLRVALVALSLRHAVLGFLEFFVRPTRCADLFERRERLLPQPPKLSRPVLPPLRRRPGPLVNYNGVGWIQALREAGLTTPPSRIPDSMHLRSTMCHQANPGCAGRHRKSSPGSTIHDDPKPKHDPTKNTWLPRPCDWTGLCGGCPAEEPRVSFPLPSS